MAQPKIPGGYYIKARIIKHKKIAHCAPCVREIWDYLLREVTYKDHGTLKKGQLLIRYQDMMDDLKWFVGYRKETYSIDQTKKAMKVLRNLSMITTTKARGGVLVTLLNHAFYNDLNNYEGTNESTDEGTNESTEVAPTINKKDKELKKEKNKTKSKKFDAESREMKICKYFFAVLRKSRPEQPEPNWQNWCKDIELFLKKSKATNEEIKTVINYAHDPMNATDKFSWIPNLRSPKKLREHFERILLQVSQKPTSKPTQNKNQERTFTVEG
jgi:hypothetical protein